MEHKGMQFEKHYSKTKEVNKWEFDNELPPESDAPPYRRQIVWFNVMVFLTLHLGALYGGYLMFTKVKWATFFFGYFYGNIGGLGITVGAHRLWSHKAFKAKLPLRLMLIYFNTIALQNSALEWVRDHRMHHKYMDTNGDPYNSKRGFFFCHMGWLMVKKHPDIINKGHTCDMSDMWSDPIVSFQHRHFHSLGLLIAAVIPALIPTLWGESLSNAIITCVVYRVVGSLHCTWVVNSLGHIYGWKPYNKNISPVDSLFATICSQGEGYHNYHHTFPRDYRAGESGYLLNMSTLFLDIMAKIGWAYDLKTVSKNVVIRRIKNYGDGSHKLSDELRKEQESTL